MTRLNLGCGQFPLKDFLNIDTLDKYGDEHWDITSPPYVDNSVDEIYAGHVLEHLSHDQTIGTLKQWHRILKPGGQLTIVVPDFYKAINFGLPYDELNAIIYGYHESSNISELHKQITSDKDVLSWLTDFSKREIVSDSPYMVSKIGWQSIIIGIK